MQYLSLTANKGDFKNLIQKIIFNRDLHKFEKKFFADMEKTTIVISPQKKEGINNKEWSTLIYFILKNTENIKFEINVNNGLN